VGVHPQITNFTVELTLAPTRSDGRRPANAVRGMQLPEPTQTMLAVRTTALCLSCTARAHMPMPRGAAVAATTLQIEAATFATGVTPRSQWSNEPLQRRAYAGR
jgi:hypothetical protein